MKLMTKGEVQVLRLDHPHLVLNDTTLDAWRVHLDQVEAVEGPTSLVITGSGKSFHQGLVADHRSGRRTRGPLHSLTPLLPGAPLPIPISSSLASVAAKRFCWV